MEGEREPMSDREYIALPIAILDGIIPTGFTLYTRHRFAKERLVDLLEREVDRGLLKRSGDGTPESPYRYEEAVPGAFERPTFVTKLDDANTRRLLDRLGLNPADVSLGLVALRR